MISSPFVSSLVIRNSRMMIFWYTSSILIQRQQQITTPFAIVSHQAVYMGQNSFPGIVDMHPHRAFGGVRVTRKNSVENSDMFPDTGLEPVGNFPLVENPGLELQPLDHLTQ